jgi:hypothetical protein
MPGDPRTLARAHIMTARPRIDSLHGIGLHWGADALNLLMIDAQVLLSNLEGADEVIAHLRDRVRMLEAEVARLGAAPAPRAMERPE